MICEAMAKSAQQELDALLNRVCYQHDEFIITSDGRPIAALVGMSEFDRIRQNALALHTFCNEIAVAFSECSEAEIEQILQPEVAHCFSGYL
jgi:prevent-host-death family protein